MPVMRVKMELRDVSESTDTMNNGDAAPKSRQRLTIPDPTSFAALEAAFDLGLELCKCEWNELQANVCVSRNHEKAIVESIRAIRVCLAQWFPHGIPREVAKWVTEAHAHLVGFRKQEWYCDIKRPEAFKEALRNPEQMAASFVSNWQPVAAILRMQFKSLLKPYQQLCQLQLLGDTVSQGHYSTEIKRRLVVCEKLQSDQPTSAGQAKAGEFTQDYQGYCFRFRTFVPGTIPAATSWMKLLRVRWTQCGLSEERFHAQPYLTDKADGWWDKLVQFTRGELKQISAKKFPADKGWSFCKSDRTCCFDGVLLFRFSEVRFRIFEVLANAIGGISPSDLLRRTWNVESNIKTRHGMRTAICHLKADISNQVPAISELELIRADGHGTQTLRRIDVDVLRHAVEAKRKTLGVGHPTA